MAPRLVNTAPGESVAAVKPGGTVHLGLKSETLKVPLASTLVQMGLTNVTHHGMLPENDTAVSGLGATVTLETSERRRPIDGVTPVTVPGGVLTFTKSNLLDGEIGIYEVKFPITERASVLAHFKFKTKTAWTAFAADWCTLSNMTGMYFGLEHGTFNTAAYAFLRANTGSGSLVVGGPLQSYSTVRPGQVEVLPGAPHAATPGFAWRGLANNSAVEVFIYFNVAGYESSPAAGIATNVPLVEIWTKIPSDPAPVVQAYIPVGALGTFPSSTANPAFTNSRPGISKTATIFFGNIARTAGSDVLELTDWALYPDFRNAVAEGEARPDHSLIARPDAPVEYNANQNKVPTESSVGRWFPETAGGWVDPTPALFFQPGRRSEALYTSLPKTSTVALSAIHKTEPRFEERVDGIMVEAFLAGAPATKVVDGTGLGFSVEDGDKLYQVLMVETPTQRFFTICKDLGALTDLSTGYYLPTSESDFRSLKLVRLVIDRHRPVSIGGGKAQLYVDDELVLTTDLSADTFPLASSSVGKIRIGSLALFPATGKVNLATVRYLCRYLAWEGVDTLAPDDAGINAAVKFTPVIDGAGGSQAMVSGNLEITKADLGGTTKYLFSKAQSFAEVDGMQVDFKMQVDNYQDFGGTPFAPASQTGATLTVFLGTKKVEVGFYACGSHGRQIAILPSTGNVSDVINQTAAGRAVSTPFDWTQMTQYRLIVKGHDRIELIIGSPNNPASITIPWTDETLGFDLPADVSAPRLEFGHSDYVTTSLSRWQYVRWGLSNGFEVAVQQNYPEGYPTYLFGGRVLIKSEFDEA